MRKPPKKAFSMFSTWLMAQKSSKAKNRNDRDTDAKSIQNSQTITVFNNLSCPIKSKNDHSVKDFTHLSIQFNTGQKERKGHRYRYRYRYRQVQIYRYIDIWVQVPPNESISCFTENFFGLLKAFLGQIEA